MSAHDLTDVDTSSRLAQDERPNVAARDHPAVSRRFALSMIGVGAATAFVVADSAVAYRAYDQGVLAEGRGPAFTAWSTWRSGGDARSMIGAAVLAANAHNTQPWLFTVSESKIDLSADLARNAGPNDASGRELYVSLGCALENLVLAAQARGRRAEVALMPGSSPDRAASVRLSPTGVSTDALYAVIGDRHSNRSEYRRDPVPVEYLDSMVQLVDESVAPARLAWLTTAAERAQFSELLVTATRDHIADEEQSRASFAWWRSDWDQVQRSMDGLNIDGVGLPPVIRTMGKLLPAPSRQSADRTFLERTVIQAQSAAAFGVIIVDDPSSPAERLAGGRLAQRLHLWSTAHGLGFQHMNQITERIDRDRQLSRTQSLQAPLEQLVGPGTLVAFRVGTPTVTSLKSPRRPASEVVS